MDFADVRTINRAVIGAGKAHRAVQADLLALLGLHPGQDLLLWTLAQAPDGLVVSALTERLGVEQPTVTRTLARLEAGDWVVRTPVPGDRRAVCITLSDHARETIPKIESTWRTLAETATAGLDPDEREQLTRLLERVRGNLHATTDHGRGACSLADEDPATE